MSWKDHWNTTRSPLRRHRLGPTRSPRCHSPIDSCLFGREEPSVALHDVWFGLLAVLFLGFLILEGFDFGVGMLMEPIARMGSGDREPRRRAVLNTIGPVWDGNEVWLLTAGGAMFAAFRACMQRCSRRCTCRCWRFCSA